MGLLPTARPAAIFVGAGVAAVGRPARSSRANGTDEPVSSRA